MAEDNILSPLGGMLVEQGGSITPGFDWTRLPGFSNIPGFPGTPDNRPPVPDGGGLPVPGYQGPPPYSGPPGPGGPGTPGGQLPPPGVTPGTPGCPTCVPVTPGGPPSTYTGPPTYPGTPGGPTVGLAPPATPVDAQLVIPSSYDDASMAMECGYLDWLCACPSPAMYHAVLRAVHANRLTPADFDRLLKKCCLRAGKFASPPTTGPTPGAPAQPTVDTQWCADQGKQIACANKTKMLGLQAGIKMLVAALPQQTPDYVLLGYQRQIAHIQRLMDACDSNTAWGPAEIQSLCDVAGYANRLSTDTELKAALNNWVGRCCTPAGQGQYVPPTMPGVPAKPPAPGQTTPGMPGMPGVGVPGLPFPIGIPALPGGGYPALPPGGGLPALPGVGTPTVPALPPAPEPGYGMNYGTTQFQAPPPPTAVRADPGAGGMVFTGIGAGVGAYFGGAEGAQTGAKVATFVDQATDGAFSGAIDDIGSALFG